MPNAIIYCRVSSDRQVKEGHGLDGQELRCRKYAQDHGYEVAAVFRDEGVSGGIIDREGMQELLDFLDGRGGEDQCVVIIDDISTVMDDAYDLAGVCNQVTAYLDALNNWYIRRSRTRFWRGELDRTRQ